MERGRESRREILSQIKREREREGAGDTCGERDSGTEIESSQWGERL